MQIEAPTPTADILLLETSTTNTALIQQAAEDSRITAVSACPDILAFLRQEGLYKQSPRPDLIILDLDLSREADCKVLTELKKDVQFRRIPIVVLAQSDDYSYAFQAYDLHANAYLCKPENPDDFVRVMRTTLEFWLRLVRLPKD